MAFSPSNPFQSWPCIYGQCCTCTNPQELSHQLVYFPHRAGTAEKRGYSSTCRPMLLGAPQAYPKPANPKHRINDKSTENWSALHFNKVHPTKSNCCLPPAWIKEEQVSIAVDLSPKKCSSYYTCYHLINRQTPTCKKDLWAILRKFKLHPDFLTSRLWKLDEKKGLRKIAGCSRQLSAVRKYYYLIVEKERKW